MKHNIEGWKLAIAIASALALAPAFAFALFVIVIATLPVLPLFIMLVVAPLGSASG